MTDDTQQHTAPSAGHAATLFDTGLEPEVSGEAGPAVGDRFGHYHVLKRLGAGAMGTVVEAYDETLDRRVAIKLLHERQSGRQEKRLLREAQALARLSHPNVVQVYEVGEAAGHLFIAMELVEGETLDQWQTQPRPWREIASVYLQAGRGLAAAHAEALIHRDFKPSNCIIDGYGRVKVLDFGLARESGDSSEIDATLSASNHSGILELLAEDGTQSNRALSQALTRTGALLGTPAYMAPEQLRGSGADAHSDQFNFCVALYEALYRVRPFANDSIGELISEVLGGKLRPPPSRSGVPGSLWPIVRRGLSTRPQDRWPSMEALLERLERVSGRRMHRRVLGVASVMLAAAGGMLWGQADVAEPCSGARERLEGVWNEARARSVGDAIIATGVSYAGTTRERVTSRAGEYAERWIEQHTAACEATRVHQAQSVEVLDLRMRCLEERRVALGRTLEQLEVADETMVENAVSMFAALPALDHCEDVAALQDDLPPPVDETIAAEVDALRDQLAKVRVLQVASHDDEAQSVIDPVLVRAEALGHGPLTVEARFEHGRTLMGRGLYPEAEAAFIAAYDLALELDYAPMAAHAARQLTRVVGYEQARHEVGRTWGLTAEAMARRFEPEGSMHALSMRNTAIVNISSGRAGEAIERFEHIVRIQEAQPEPGLDLAVALGDMGNVRMHQERYDEALALYRRANELKLSLLGEGHPELAIDFISIGRVHEKTGELDDARTAYERALELYTEARGPGHPDLAIVLNNLAVLHDLEGHPDQALELYERVLTIRMEALGPEHPFVAQTLANIGLAYQSKGEYERALGYFERAVARLRASEGGDVEQALFHLAETEFQLDRLDDARAHCEEHLALVRARADEKPHSIAFVQFQLARVQWAQGEHDDARVQVEQAKELAANAGPLGQPILRSIEEWIADRPKTEPRLRNRIDGP